MNMHLEHFHKELKHIYFEDEKCKRDDKCLKNLEDYIENKTYDKLMKFHEGKNHKKTVFFTSIKKGKIFIRIVCKFQIISGV